MSKLMENKQLVHMASEVVVLMGLTFYFSQKNKKLMGHIEDLAQRVEEQEDLLQKHEQVIRKLVDLVNQLQTVPVPPPQQLRGPKLTPNAHKNKKHPVTLQRHRSEPLQTIGKQQLPVHTSNNKSLQFEQLFSENEEEYEDENEEEYEDDEEVLDKEIAEELLELNEYEEGDLKKQD